MRLLVLVLAMLIFTLAATCSKTAERPPFLPPPEPVPPPAARWDVRTDYSALTPYVPPNNMYSRLRPGPLPELLPSNDYGMLLPYSGAVVMDNGNLREVRSGFVTIDGVIVTDLVYDRIERAAYYLPLDIMERPAYRLVVNTMSPESSMYFHQSKAAACALDGSWITEFDYVEVIFSDTVIFLIRDHGSYDIDVYDYSGRKLYNTLELEWINDIHPNQWPGSLAYDVSEGYGFVKMQDGTVAAYEALTGNIRNTEYAGAWAFCEGFATVTKNSIDSGDYPELWGYINRDFELVIPPAYTQVRSFQHGWAVVETGDGSQQIINTRGETLFSIPYNYQIELNFDGTGFIVIRFENWQPEAIYTKDLVKIDIPERMQWDTPNVYIRYIGDGFYSVGLEDGLLLFTQDTEHFFPGFSESYYMNNEYFVFYVYDDSVAYTGVMSIEGREIIPRKKDVSITPAVYNDVTIAFIENSNSVWYYSEWAFQPSAYRLIGMDGQVLAAGPGVLSFDQNVGLYSVLGADFFTWLDRDANVIISIPLMSYTLD